MINSAKKAHHQFRCPSATMLDRWYEKFKPIMMTWDSLCQLQLPTTEMTVSVWFLPKWCFALNSDISTLVSSLQRTQRSISLFRSSCASLNCAATLFFEKRGLRLTTFTSKPSLLTQFLIVPWWTFNMPIEACSLWDPMLLGFTISLDCIVQPLDKFVGDIPSWEDCGIVLRHIWTLLICKWHNITHADDQVIESIWLSARGYYLLS